jgi:hypothetical protein
VLEKKNVRFVDSAGSDAEASVSLPITEDLS